MSDIRVDWHPQYKPSASGGIITGYRVYMWSGHKLLGALPGQEVIVKTRYQAQRTATMIRKWLDGKGSRPSIPRNWQAK